MYKLPAKGTDFGWVLVLKGMHEENNMRRENNAQREQCVGRIFTWPAKGAEFGCVLVLQADRISLKKMI